MKSELPNKARVNSEGLTGPLYHFTRYINNYCILNDLTLDDLARQAKISPDRLKTFGLNPKQMNRNDFESIREVIGFNLTYEEVFGVPTNFLQRILAKWMSRR